VRYSGKNQAHALTLVYERDRLVRVEAGPDLLPDDVDWLRARIASDLLGPERKKIARDIVFSSLPVDSALRIDDLVQLLPAPPEAARPPFLMGDHPLVMEFPFYTSQTVWTNVARRARGAHELALLLNVLFHGGMRQLGQGYHNWSFVPDTRNEADLGVRYLQQGYLIPGFIGEQDDFTSIESIRPMALVRGQEYFERLGISPGMSLDCADWTPDLVRVFFRLDEARRRLFSRATFWYDQARRARSPSSAFVATVSAIETLAPRDTTSARCEACDRSLAKGPTQRFIDFLEDIVPDQARSRAARKRLYWRRSRLAHGEALFLRDEELTVALHPQTNSEWRESGYAIGLAGAVFINWLMRVGSPPSPAKTIGG